ncbi:MAG: response regulator transcription factor [Proteobacteria bacterium]|nr:response regulator transcription factor [Pseudomonadota bacterium]
MLNLSSERRLHDRRQHLHDRRNSSVLRGRARYDRRRNDRRDLTMLQRQLPYLRVELAKTQLTLESSVVEHDSGMLRLWVITEHTDLNNLFSGYPDRLPHIRISQSNFKEMAVIDDKFDEIYPDVLLIDMRLSVDRVVEQLRIIRKKMPEVKIILLYEQDLPELIHEIIEYRISGFLQIGADYKIFEKAIHVIVHRGELWFPHRLIRKIFDTLSSWQNRSQTFLSRDIVFTKCEQEIIKLVTKGLANKQIAQQLTVSPETVKKHLKSIFIKTGIRNRSQLVFSYFSGRNDFKQHNL